MMPLPAISSFTPFHLSPQTMLSSSYILDLRSENVPVEIAKIMIQKEVHLYMCNMIQVMPFEADMFQGQQSRETHS